jgi:ribonuclease BN (tRNA processing enzyme)
MKIKVLGTRGEVKSSAPHHSKKSGILIDNKILIDVGEKEFIGLNPQIIFITHLHPDHAFFIRNESECSINHKITIYAPEEYNNHFHKVAINNKYLRFHMIKCHKLFTRGTA